MGGRGVPELGLPRWPKLGGTEMMCLDCALQVARVRGGPKESFGEKIDHRGTWTPQPTPQTNLQRARGGNCAATDVSCLFKDTLRFGRKEEGLFPGFRTGKLRQKLGEKKLLHFEEQKWGSRGRRNYGWMVETTEMGIPKK